MRFMIFGLDADGKTEFRRSVRVRDHHVATSMARDLLGRFNVVEVYEGPVLIYRGHFGGEPLRT